MEKKLTEHEVNQYSPLALAFLGDSVYERLVRKYLLLTANMPASVLHELKIKKVCAAFQSQALEKLFPILDEMETAIVKRGRNATGNTVPKHSNAAEYRRATGFEALFGYLDMLGKYDRIEQLFNLIIEGDLTGVPPFEKDEATYMLYDNATENLTGRDSFSKGFPPVKNTRRD